MRILIIKLRYLGDLILTLPLINVIKQYMPSSCIDIVTKKRYKGVFDAYDVEVNPIYLEDGFKTKNVYGVVKRIRSKTYDYVFDLNSRIDGFMLSWLSRARVKASTERYNSALRHVMRLIYSEILDREVAISEKEQNFRFLSLLGVSKNEVNYFSNKMSFFPKVRACRIGSNFDRYFGRLTVGVHPFASRKTKIWSHSNFVDLINRLLVEYPGARVLLLGNKYDCSEAGELMAGIGSNRVFDLTGETSICGVVSVINRLDLFIGNDSGLMHIADSLDKKVVALFGPTSYIRWGPRNSDATILCNNVSCAPCSHRQCVSMECMGSIGVEDVLNVVRRKLIRG